MPGSARSGAGRSTLPLVEGRELRRFADLTEAELRRLMLWRNGSILLFGAVWTCSALPMLIAASCLLRSFAVYYDRYFIHESLFVAGHLA